MKPVKLPSIPPNFPAWCKAHNVSMLDIESACGISARQARRLFDGESGIKRAQWQAVYNYSQEK